MPYKVGMVSLGCPKNLVDSEVMLGLLCGGDRRAFSLTTDPAEAELLVVNTCGFIDKARKESVSAILEMARMKREGRCKALVVTGCLVQAHAQALQAEVPEIDGFLGSADYPGIREVAQRLLRSGGGRRAKEWKVSQPAYLYDGESPRLLATPGYSAYLKVSEGCDHACGFCAIPSLRGRLRSRTVESCAAEAEALAARGVRELIVVSQDTSEYGRDLYGEPRLLALLQALCKVRSLRWVRVQYLFPAFLGPELLEWWGGEPRMAQYVDLPLQHADDRLLKAMRRPGTRAQNLALLKRIRKAMPHAALRSSFIVGHPGEDAAAFKSLLNFVEEAGIDRAGFFSYSPEAGTPSALLKPQVPARERESRRKQALLFSGRHSRRRLARFKGRSLTVLATAPGLGRSEYDAPEIDGLVRFTVPAGGAAPKAGEFVSVRIVGNDDHDLMGELEP